ncbi:MAG: M48 family metallopeptidase [Pseudomonadota bacterium]
MSPERRSFPGLHADAYVHPSDRAALESLRAVPGLDALIRALASGTVERQIHAINSRTSIRVGPRQFPSLHRLVERAAATLDVPVPDTYIGQQYSVNATAFGFERYTLTLNAGLVDVMEDEQLLAVIGHELGHMLCDHMLYKSLAHLIAQVGLKALAALTGGAALVVGVPLQLALLSWSRAAEYSCDRAGLLVVQEPEVVATALARLAGRPRRFAHEFSLEALREQFTEFTEKATTVERLYALAHELGRTHPDVVWRAHEILSWGESEQYREILAGRYTTRAQIHARREPAIEGHHRCPACDRWAPNGQACPHCGLREEPEHRVLCPEGHVADGGWRFCRRCGKGLG